jgi:hypothetical protein
MGNDFLYLQKNVVHNDDTSSDFVGISDSRQISVKPIFIPSTRSVPSHAISPTLDDDFYQPIPARWSLSFHTSMWDFAEISYIETLAQPQDNSYIEAIHNSNVCILHQPYDPGGLSIGYLGCPPHLRQDATFCSFAVSVVYFRPPALPPEVIFDLTTATNSLYTSHDIAALPSANLTSTMAISAPNFLSNDAFSAPPAHPNETDIYFWKKFYSYKAAINSALQPLMTSFDPQWLLFGYHFETYVSLELSFMLRLRRKTRYTMWPFAGPPTFKQFFYV